MHLTESSFQQLDLPEDLRRGIADCGFDRMTPVQARSLPITLEGRDLAVQAQTGSGKTAVFLVTIFNRILRHPRPKTTGVCPRALVITPTRELAVQIASDAAEIGRHLSVRTVAAYGGVDYRQQREAIADGVDLLIGTPGRLIDYWKQKVYHLRNVEVAVIDEADRMFDMGFVSDIRYLLRRMSRYDQRQSMLFSATISQRVLELSYEYMNAPDLVEITPEQVTAERIEQVLYHVSSRQKFSLLLGLLKREDWTKALVFVNTKRMGNELQERLERNGFPCAVLSGDVSQPHRMKILKRYLNGEVKILVATDVASRGLHVDDISHVFNYDLPLQAEDYVHRIGRTARAGAAGKAISLACDNYVYGLEDIQEYIGTKIPVDWPDEDWFEVEVPRPRKSRSRSGADKGRPPAGSGRRRSRRRPRPGAAGRTPRP